jgi:hemerythrin-like domain-containing protein
MITHRTELYWQTDHDVPEPANRGSFEAFFFALMKCGVDDRLKRGTMRCTELIAQDHAVLRQGLNILDRMVQIMEEGDRIEILDIRTVLKFLRMFGDEYHQSMEEKVLFPVLLRAAPHDVIQGLMLEHHEERELVTAIEDALSPKHGIGFVRNSRQLILLLRKHLDMEDKVFLDIAERLLSREEDEAIATEFTAHQPQSETYSAFARLERKYAAKPRTMPRELDRRAHA